MLLTFICQFSRQSVGSVPLSKRTELVSCCCYNKLLHTLVAWTNTHLLCHSSGGQRSKMGSQAGSFWRLQGSFHLTACPARLLAVLSTAQASASWAFHWWLANVHRMWLFEALRPSCRPFFSWASDVFPSFIPAALTGLSGLFLLPKSTSALRCYVSHSQHCLSHQSIFKK